MAGTSLNDRPRVYLPPRPAAGGPDAFHRLQSVAITLLIAVCTVFPLIRTTSLFAESIAMDTYTEGSSLLQLVFGSVFALAGWLLWMNRQVAVRNLRAVNPFLLLILLWCLCSSLWSLYPVTTIKRSVQLLGLIMVGLAIAPPLGNMARFANTVLASFTVLMVLCLLASLGMPGLGVDYVTGGAWRGITWHKNVLGMVCAFSLLLWLREFRHGQLGWKMCLGGGLFTVFMLVMAKSTTSIIVAGAGSFLYLFLARRYIAPRNMLILLLGAAIGTALLLHFFHAVQGRFPSWEELMGPAAAIFNKSTDLTGRTDIWELVLVQVAAHPWLGAGYGAFWMGVGGPSQYIADFMGFVPLQAHNGYLDVLNELGIVGLVLLAGLVVVHARDLFRLMRIDRAEAALHWAFFIVILVSNISETVLFRAIELHYVWLIFSSIMVSSRLRAHQASRAAEAGAA